MWIKRNIALQVALMMCGVALAQGPPDLQIRTTRSDATVTIERGLGEGKALVGVVDARKSPVLGLTVGDFTVARAGETGRVVSVEPISQTVEVPRHVVLVVDNSYSLEERAVIRKELAELGAVLNTLRPIDDVQMVVLRDGNIVKMGGRSLHVEVFKSSKPSELGEFAARACTHQATTNNTYLNEEIFAGVELLRQAPANGPRWLWVFTDGEELNSAFGMDVVNQAAKGVENLTVAAVDCMPGPKINDPLAKLASENHGQARKAGATADLLALFQQAASRTEHRYAVSYDFPARPAVAYAPPTEPAPPAQPAEPAPSPKVVTFSQAALFDFNKWDLKPEGKAQLKRYREQTVAEMSRADRVKVTGHTDNVGSAAYNKKLSLKRAQTVRAYLVSLGVDPGKFEVSGEGMDKPVADNSTKEGRAKNRRVEVEVIGLGK
jgi:OOP family OmpA-OmpF porin